MEGLLYISLLLSFFSLFLPLVKEDAAVWAHIGAFDESRVQWQLASGTASMGAGLDFPRCCTSFAPTQF